MEKAEEGKVTLPPVLVKGSKFVRGRCNGHIGCAGTQGKPIEWFRSHRYWSIRWLERVWVQLRGLGVGVWLRVRYLPSLQCCNSFKCQILILFYY